MTKQTATTTAVAESTNTDIRDIRLLKLELENFKGIKRFSLETNGRDIAVWGDNATGKTTLADGFSWLLFGKDSQGRADFEIKTLSPSGEALHGLEHSVEAVLSIGEKKAELRKVYREKWTKRRGSAEKEFTGHTRDHFVNGVPVNQSEYESQIANFMTEEISKLLTNPIHFAERLHWQERRQKLLDVCGDISDDDVIASSQELADLSEILDGRSIDDHRRVAQAQKRKVNEELQRLPVRIDEVNRGLPDIESDEEELKRQRKSLRSRRDDADAERSRIQSGGEIAELTKRIREIESGLIEERNRQKAAEGESVGEHRTRHSQLEAERRLAQDIILREEQAIKQAEVELSELEKLMDSRRKVWHELDYHKFLPQEGDDVCAACGQNLPKEHIEEVRRKAEADFNASKASRLQEIADEGKRLRGRYDEIKVDIEKRRKSLDESKKDRDGMVRKLEGLEAQILEQLEKPLATSAKESDLEAAKAELEAEVAGLRKGTEKALAAVEDKLESLNADIIEVETRLSKIGQRRKGEERIKELKADERRLASAYEELERQLYLIEEFTRQKVSLLTDQINSHFELARFKLFDVQINGGIQEVCEVTYNGVPWASLNTGSQINIGLDVINTLSKHDGISLPIFVDHAESVTKLLNTSGQQIRLIVSEGDGKLHVEEIRQ